MRSNEDLYILIGVIVGIAFAEYYNSHSTELIGGGGEFFTGVGVALVGGLVGWLIARLTEDP